MKKSRLTLLRLQAEAFRRHGITRDQFVKITPRELRALDKDALAEWEFDRDLEERRTARILAAIYNTAANRKKGAKWLDESDFLPKKKGKQPVGKSANEMLSAVQWRHAVIHAQAKKNKQNGS